MIQQVNTISSARFVNAVESFDDKFKNISGTIDDTKESIEKVDRRVDRSFKKINDVNNALSDAKLDIRNNFVEINKTNANVDHLKQELVDDIARTLMKIIDTKSETISEIHNGIDPEIEKLKSAIKTITIIFSSSTVLLLATVGYLLIH